MPLELQFSPYKLTCDLLAEKDLRIVLEPVELSQKLDLSYEIFIKIEDNLQFTFLFGNCKKMYSYIEFYKEKCFQVDLDTVEQERKKLEKGGNLNQLNVPEISDPSPVSFRFVLMGDEKSPTIPLKGVKKLLNREARLEGIIIEQLNIIQGLKSKLKESQAQNAKLKEKIQVLRLEKEQLVQQRTKQNGIEKPKKRVHMEPKQNEVLQQSLQQPLTMQQDYPFKQPHEEDIDDLSFNENPYMNQSSLNVPLNDCNNHRNLQTNSPQTVSSQESFNQNKRSGVQQSERSSYQTASFYNEDKESSSKFHQSSVTIRNAPEDFDDHDHNTSFNEKPNTFTRPSPINTHKEKLKENDIAKLVEVFVGECLVDVGFNERGQPKTGFVCVFCEKIFKESDFLRKHVLTRHPEILESHANESFLRGKLIQYKANREAQINVQMRQKKIEKMLKNNN